MVRSKMSKEVKIADQELAALLLDILREMRVNSRGAGRALGLGRAQQGVLQVLIRNNGIDMKTLAERLEVRQPSATVAVDPLVERGLVERSPDSNDGRVTRVFLTRKAKGLAKRLRAAQLEAGSELLEALNKRDKETLVRLFKKILDNKEKLWI